MCPLCKKREYYNHYTSLDFLTTSTQDWLLQNVDQPRSFPNMLPNRLRLLLFFADPYRNCQVAIKICHFGWHSGCWVADLTIAEMWPKAMKWKELRKLCKRERTLKKSILFDGVSQDYKRDLYNFVHISIVNERANCQMMPNPFHVTATQMKKHSLIWHIRTSLCLLRIFLTTVSVAVLGICSNEDWHLLWDHLSCRSQRCLCWRILICKLLMWFQ